VDDDDQMAAEAHQQELEARGYQEEQMRREAEAFDRYMTKLWNALRRQWCLNEQERIDGDHG